jgi:peptide/nickel transport system permease protein
MGRYLAIRVAGSVAVLFAMTLLVFVGFVLIPQNPNRFLRPDNPYRAHGSLMHQYGGYVWRIVRHGDFGTSYSDREPVTSRLFQAAPVTLSLVLGGLIVWLLIAIPLGVLSAYRPRSWLDRVATVFVLFGLAAHPLWLGRMLSLLFGDHLHAFPSTGYCDLFSPSTECGGPVQWTSHLLMPWFVLGVLNAALYTLMIRAYVRDELESDYVRTARAKGAGERRVLGRHILRNVALPVTTMVGMSVGVALGGVIFVESAFGLPGLGGMLRRSMVVHDVPLTAGIIIFVTFVIVLLNLLVDVAYALLDPRIAHRRGLQLLRA